MNLPRDPLPRALDALPAPPPPPPLARVFVAVEREARRRGRVRAGLAVAAGVLVAGGAAVAMRPERKAPDGERRPAVAAAARGVVGEALTPDALVVRRGAAPVATEPTLRLGDDVEARDAGRVRLDGRVTLALDAGARVTLTSAGEVAQEVGRVRYDVGHDAGDGPPRGPPRTFTVTAAGVRIIDVGTRFTVDVGPPEVDPLELGPPAGRAGVFGGAPPVRVLVTVEEGEVSVAREGAPADTGRALRAGRGLAWLAGQGVGDDWPTDARPVLALEVETANPRVGEPVVCRVTLRNPTDAWLPLPTPDDGALLLVEVVGEDRVARPIRVTDAMRLPPRPGSAIPPRGTEVVRVQFQRTFASPGAYRLRAVYRPADAVDPPRSPEALLTVR